MNNNFSLILGCGGYSYNDVILCAETQNIIVNFGKHHDDNEFEKIMDFLDFSCRLFDQTIADWNKITNILKILREQFNLIDDKKWEALYMWLPIHKRCGAYLMLKMDIS